MSKILSLQVVKFPIWLFQNNKMGHRINKWLFQNNKMGHRINKWWPHFNKMGTPENTKWGAPTIWIIWPSIGFSFLFLIIRLDSLLFTIADSADSKCQDLAGNGFESQRSATDSMKFWSRLLYNQFVIRTMTLIFPILEKFAFLI